MRMIFIRSWVLCLGVAFLATTSAMAAAPQEEGRRLGKTCAGCHGTAGASPGRLIPVIGGQVAPFVKKAMLGYRDDSRTGSVMVNLSKGYDADGIQAMSVWFSAQPWVKTPHAAPADAIAAGISRAAACKGCHGANGEGKAIFPRLAGQAPEYSRMALQEYRDGTRNVPMMRLISGYEDADLEILARYYSALP